MAKPYYRADGTPGVTITLTSGRVDQFTKSDAIAAIALDTIANVVNVVLIQE